MGFFAKNRITDYQLSIRHFEFVIFNFILFSCISCTETSTPKPYSYFRIAIPDTAYIPFVQANLSPFTSHLSPLTSHLSPRNYPYTFDLSVNAVVQPVDNEPYWINLYYPDFDATIHCSYKPVRHNLRELTNDALDLVYRNANFASAIPEQGYSHPEARVYGVLFDLEGNTASSCQFFVTDSVHHFFRASVYCNCHPNADSLAPVYNYLRKDVIRMVESFEWK